MLAELMRELFLSPVLIVLILFVLFMILTYWALAVLKEYPGYGLGWLVGLFFVVVYVSLGGWQTDGAEQNLNSPLNIFQVLCPGIVGILLGGALVFALRIGNSYSAARGIKIAAMTALGVVLLFLMFMVGVATQRMIGIFALAFCIAALAGIVFLRGTATVAMFSAQAVPGEEGGPRTGGFSRLDQIRARMRERNQRP